MSEGHEEPPADVRAFLPRPGEPVEDYAERLRALHRDLTLVLQAVERGLAVSAERESGAEGDFGAEGESGPERESGAERQQPPGSGGAAPGGGGSVAALRHETVLGGPRVEVIRPPSGAGSRAEGEDRRAAVPPDEAAGGERPSPAPASASLPPRPSAGVVPTDVHVPDPVGVERPEPAEHVPPPAPSPVASPRAVRVEASVAPPRPREHPWVDSPARPDATVVPATRRSVSPLLVTAAITGWLVVATLALALLLD